ncbi:hypothetical protein [Streptomyces malaysiensis]|uniref:hypothetical protein n=1 Tax=Streptomyces malaysiensis TaxID=92644 RepID=UPI0033C9DB85
MGPVPPGGAEPGLSTAAALRQPSKWPAVDSGPHSGSVAVISVPGLALRSAMARIAAVMEGGGRPRTVPAPATPAVTGADRERKPAVGVARDR